MKVVAILFVFLLSSSEGLIFECIFSMTSWEFAPNMYQCGTTVSSLEIPEILESVRGNHLEGKGNYNVAALNVNHQTIFKFPKNIENFFPHLKAINIQNSKLSGISADDLKPFPNLIVASFSQNNLISLPGDLFKFTLNIKNIVFDRNSIEHVGHDLLKDLTDLQLAHFQNNPCINVLAKTPQALSELRKQLTGCPSLDSIPPLRCQLRDDLKRIVNDLEKQISKISAVSCY